MIDMNKIGERIRNIRKSKKMTQAQLAEYAGLSTEYVCEIENCKKRASLIAFVGISEVLEMSMDELLYGTRHEDLDVHGMILVLEDCSAFEKRMICKNISELKQILRKNKGSI